MREVVGAVVRRGGLVLAARRNGGPPSGGRWEFPGGKVEPGESAADALARELVEELALRVEVGAEVAREGGPWPVSERYELRLFLCDLVGADPSVGEDHDEVRWLRPEELTTLDWLEADRLALPAVLAALG